MPEVSYRKLATDSVVLVIILCALVPHPLLSLNPNVQFSLSPSIGGGDTIGFTSSNTTTPATGVARIVAIAVDFDDRAFSLPIPDLSATLFHRLSDYIASASYGKLRIEGTVAGPFRVSRAMSQYGADNGVTDGDPATGVRTYELVQDAIKLADPSVDFTAYQYLIIVHAGDGQESNPKITQNIWSIAYLRGIVFKTNETSYDRAAIVPESESEGLDTLGAFAHEFLHLLGLPDLYNTEDPGGADAGKWDVMARGLWNGNPPGSDPAHPTAWSKSLLGWLGPEQIAQIGPGQSLTAYLDSLEQRSPNLKAVKIELSESLFHIVEYRSRTLNRGLPDEGVLITLVDLRKPGSSGAMTIVSTRGEINKAPLKLGESYVSNAEQLLISTRFSNGTAYGIDIIRGEYRTVEINLPGTNSTVLVDGNPCTTSPTGRTTIFVTPGNHTIAIPGVMAISTGMRAVFDAWSDGVTENERIVQTEANVSLSTVYKEQALLFITSNGIPDTLHPTTVEVNGMSFALDDLTPADAWVALNQAANVTILTSIVSVDESTRYVFKGWNGENPNSTLSLQVSQPLELIAQFQEQFYLRIRSEFGNPNGEGWYDNGATASFNVSSPHYVGETERYLLESWSGSESEQGAASVVMDQPYTMTAQWRRQLLVNIAVLGSDGQPLQGGELKMRLEAPNGTEIVQTPEKGVWLDDGVWFVRSLQWMNVDVSPSERSFRPADGGTWIIRPNLHTLTIVVNSLILRRGISGITVSLELPDGQLYLAHTNETGEITISNLPSYEYHVRLTREADVVSFASFYMAQDIRLDTTISDPLENVVVAAFALAGTVSLTLVAMPSALSKLKSKRRKLDSAALNERVYEYILSHAGVISKSKASRDLGISREALMRAIRNLSTTPAKEEPKRKPS